MQSLASRFAVAVAATTVALAVSLGAPGVARAQVTDQATCSSSLPACTTTRLSCCTRDFTGSSTAKAILIPTDRCHQQIANGGTSGPPNGSGSAPNWCADNPGTNVNSMFYTYGLVYRLMQSGIPVYWLANPSKRPTTISVINTTETTKDIDFWVLSSGANPPAPASPLTALVGTAPVQRLTTDGALNLIVASSYSKNEFPVRGGAFLIAPQDRAAFETFWKKRVGRTGCGSSADCYDFRDVYLYQIDPSAHFSWQDFTQPLVSGKYVKHDSQVPVAMNIDYAPPKIARFYSGATLSNWLKAANLDDPATNTTSCKTGTAFTPADAVGCDLAESDVQAGNLVSAGFNWAWIDTGVSGTCATTMAKIGAFMTAIPGTYTAGNVMFSNAGISLAEQCGSSQVLGKTGTGLSVQTGAANEGNSKPPFIIRFPNNLFAQYGDLALDFATGSVASWDRWTATGGDLYNAVYATSSTTLRRLVTQESATATIANPYCNGADGVGTRHDNTSVANCDNATAAVTSDFTDMFAYGRFLNNKNNGLAFYSPGSNVTQSSQQAQLKMILSSLIATPPFTVEQVFTRIEVSRNAPIVATIGTTNAIVQGTFEHSFVTKNGVDFPVPRTIPGVFVHDDLANFTFPVERGHLRATSTGSITTTATTLDTGTVLFDAADNIPPVTFSGCSAPYTGACRTIFTTVGTGATPGAPVLVDEAHVSTVGPLMLNGFTTADQTVFIDRILKGYDNGSGYVAALGGVDRSTVAVIGKGASVGATRPTVAYFGATDGMLHAVCASIGGTCDTLGKELWAYLPRVNLSSVRYNTARIDGSPHVLDVRGDFTNSGAKTFKTVLTFQTGSGDPTTADATPAVYALDITDPTKPTVLWEYTIANVNARGTFELGVGLTVAAGEATIGGVKKNLTLVQTNNGGTAGAGTVVTAINTETGAALWTFTYKYPSPPRVATDIVVPPTGIPGGVVTVDKTAAGGNGFMTDLVFTDLYGNLWELDPATGTSRYKDVSLNPIPLFSFSTDYHPIGAKPAIFSNGGQQFAVFTSGGYADTSTNAGWGLNTNTQYLIAVGLDTPTTGNPILPMTENTSSSFLPIKFALGAGERGFSQATVIGNEVFVTTDTARVNASNYGTSTTNTGKVYRVNTATGVAGTTATTAGGATTIANDGTKLYNSGGGKHQQIGTDAAGTTGAAVTAADAVTKLVRKLWLRTE